MGSIDLGLHFLRLEEFRACAWDADSFSISKICKMYRENPYFYHYRPRMEIYTHDFDLSQRLSNAAPKVEKYYI